MEFDFLARKSGKTDMLKTETLNERGAGGLSEAGDCADFASTYYMLR